ncbi:MAG TPA: sigma-54 dependent transcriptional regulator [Pyrinomonadaceae bacterium]|jgi:DNA-binding NtrC family response regulator|nr:sigma-54 dependent transcriptional regulator [Pyrinomonadaceae bacterium]
MKAKILVVEDDLSLQKLLLEAIGCEGHETQGADSVGQALELLKTEKFDVLLTDVQLKASSGLDLLPIALQHNPDCFMLVMTGHGTIDIAVQAMKLGAADFLSKPISLNDLISAIRVAAERSSETFVAETSRKKQEVSIIAKSKVMNDLLEQVATIAGFNLNVLVTGETGTGKELIARAIHKSSPRTKNAFVALNCAAIPEQLLEDELFGHVKGAFTGAQTDRAGRFEQAHNGTLFLDEIGDMNLALQAKLLRVLQESEFEKVGSSKTIKVDVRIVAATSADLGKKIDDGSFRADLFHRLNVVHLRIPPLRERPGDMLPLAQGLLDNFCQKSGLPKKSISAETVNILNSYHYPGNVRQLQNCMERAAVFSGVKTEILPEHLPDEIGKNRALYQPPVSQSFRPDAIPDEGIDFLGVVSNLERELLLQTLDKTGGNKMQAAKLLNMKRTTLVEKIKRLNIEEENDDKSSETKNASAA